MDDPIGWRFDHSYLRLPPSLYERCLPAPVGSPRMVVFNTDLARELGLDAARLELREGAEIFSGNRIPEGAEPMAQAYAGHQFGHFTMLGDGRAILLGEHLSPDGRRWDIQLKGAGRTPYSRRGDGRAALGPMLREYIISEAMHAMGIPTTRSLAVVATGEEVFREEPLPGAVLTRVASSHLRVGTFEYAAARGERELLGALTDHALGRHFSGPSGASRLLEGVIERQAALVARWLLVGFVHGVMNTDNMAISGETIDYGPCAFLDAYDPSAVFSSIDLHGRYAYGNQPEIAQWNLARFAESLLPVLHKNSDRALALANELLGTFPSIFQKHWRDGLLKKIGIFSECAGDQALVGNLLAVMADQQLDFTNTFRHLRVRADAPTSDVPELRSWQERWRQRLREQARPPEQAQALMDSVNPAVIPRNHLVDEALESARAGDLAPVNRLIAVLASPYDEGPDKAPFQHPPKPGTPPHRTYCGT